MVCQGVPSSFAYFRYTPFLSTFDNFIFCIFAATNIVLNVLLPVKSAFCIFAHIKFVIVRSALIILHSLISVYISRASARFAPSKLDLVRSACTKLILHKLQKEKLVLVQ